MAQMFVEALETIKSGPYVLEAGDRVHVPEEFGTRWCGAGWAKDLDGRVETGERRVINAVVQPHGMDARHTPKSPDIGVTTVEGNGNG